MERFAELIQLAHEGDKSARDALVAENLGLVRAIARRFDNRGHDREELFQIGCIGLIKAIDKFDLSLKLAFSTYAVPVITGEIRRFLRDDGMVRVSRTLKENAYKIYKAREMLCRELGREPSLAEVSAVTELSLEEIVMATEASREVESIYQPVYEKDGDELLMIDQISGSGREDFTREEPEKEAVLNQMVIDQLLGLLNEQERKLIELRYFENKT
ncbi:MAG: sigma-70 family RNA polymerase sigma factor, partial [Roseburia sp.]|nr:sigma-70 family RNA polymerase sigma factor [Roseburia sp.]